MAFIVVMILSLAAVGLAPGIGSTGGGHSGGVDPIDDEEIPEDTPAGVMAFDVAEPTIDVSRNYNAVIKTDAGDIVVALNPEAPQAANSFAFLAGQNFYDGLQFFWVLPDFDALAGDPTCEASGELSCTGAGNPGYDLPKEGDSSNTGRWSVIAPVIPGGDQVHGSQFFIALTDGEFDGSVFGEVVKGQEILEALEQRVPCFGAESSDSNPCQTEEELPQPLTILDVVVQPA